VQGNPLAADSVGEWTGRVVVVGNSAFATDRFTDRGSANLNLVLNAVDWLAEDDALIAIRAKNRTPPPLVFESDTMRDFVKYANVIGIPFLVILAAALRMLRRRQLTRRRYGAPRPAPVV
jgi:ABC-type uncharacterized transport system involved in gliding motility auxiliary subunit